MDFLIELFKWVVDLFRKPPKVDEVKSNESKHRMREIFNQSVPDGDEYKVLYASSTESKLNNFVVLRVHKTTITNYIVGYREDNPTIVLIQTTPAVTEFAEPIYFRREEIHKAYKVAMYGTYCIYPDRSQYIEIYPTETAVGAENEEYYVYITQFEEAKEFIDFFMKKFKK